MYLLSILAAREKNGESFLQRLRELESISSENRPADSKLILSTIHSSKGLEYDRVIIIDALDGILPSVPCSGRLDDEQRKTLEDERRLFYVAATPREKRAYTHDLSAAGDVYLYRAVL